MPTTERERVEGNFEIENLFDIEPIAVVGKAELLDSRGNEVNIVRKSDGAIVRVTWEQRGNTAFLSEDNKWIVEVLLEKQGSEEVDADDIKTEEPFVATFDDHTYSVDLPIDGTNAHGICRVTICLTLVSQVIEQDGQKEPAEIAGFTELGLVKFYNMARRSVSTPEAEA